MQVIINAFGCMRRMDNVLIRKAKTHGKVTVQKGHVSKTQALPFSLDDWNCLQYMKELWVLYIIEQ